MISGQEFSHLERIWNLIGFFPIQFVGTSDLVFRGILTDMAGHNTEFRDKLRSQGIINPPPPLPKC